MTLTNIHTYTICIRIYLIENNLSRKDIINYDSSKRIIIPLHIRYNTRKLRSKIQFL